MRPNGSTRVRDKNQMKKVKPRASSLIPPWERNKNVSGSDYSHFEIEGDVIEIAPVKRINDRETVRECNTEPEMSTIQTESDNNISQRLLQLISAAEKRRLRSDRKF